MILYTLSMVKDGKEIFSQDLAIEEGISFEDQVKDAFENFRKQSNFGLMEELNLLDEGVDITIHRTRPDES
jgi:hypothetical protein